MTKTHTTTIPLDLITDALDAAGLDVDIRDDEYAAVCFDDVSGLALFAFYLALEASDWDEPAADMAERMLSHTEVDPAGSGIVAYWPGYTLTEE